MLFTHERVEIFKRAFDVYREEFFEDITFYIEKCDAHDLYAEEFTKDILSYDDVRFFFTIETEDGYDEDAFLCPENRDKFNSFISLYYSSYLIFSIPITNESVEFYEHIDKEIGREFILCSCGFVKDKLVYKDGLCKECWIFATTKDDRCCICLENEKERWTEMYRCTHSFHLRCAMKISGPVSFKKCPICRTKGPLKIPYMMSN
jgi:hypothetical protein